jgi:hypothetical protein
MICAVGTALLNRTRKKNNKIQLKEHKSFLLSQDRSGYELDNQGLIPGRAGFLSLPQCPEQLWGQPSLLAN